MLQQTHILQWNANSCRSDTVQVLDQVTWHRRKQWLNNYIECQVQHLDHSILHDKYNTEEWRYTEHEHTIRTASLDIPSAPIFSFVAALFVNSIIPPARLMLPHRTLWLRNWFTWLITVKQRLLTNTSHLTLFSRMSYGTRTPRHGPLDPLDLDPTLSTVLGPIHYTAAPLSVYAIRVTARHLGLRRDVYRLRHGVQSDGLDVCKGWNAYGRVENGPYYVLMGEIRVALECDALWERVFGIFPRSPKC